MDNLKILVIGGGGREHAIIWKLKESVRVGRIFCLPGNGGIAEIAECVPTISATDIEGIVNYVKTVGDFDLVIVAPDDPLAMGLTNRLQEIGLRVFGPTMEAAQLESSKVFSKWLMKQYSIPTAEYQAFDTALAALKYIKQASFPLVIKADGLSVGKGVTIAHDYEEARKTLVDVMLGHRHGEAGNRVVIEEYLSGYEVSLMAFTDGSTIIPCLAAQDHKQVYDGDLGANTGGMGTICPVPEFGEELMQRAYDEVLLPVIGALNAEEILFKGVIFAGLMICGDEIKVLEFNARFGDPETQSVLRLLENDLLDIIDAVIDGRLHEVKLEWKSGAAVTVIAASEGYPKEYKKGLPIEIRELSEGTVLFHSGTKRTADGLVTSGGRVIGVSARGEDLNDARAKAYNDMEAVSFEGKHFRKDI